MWAIYALLSAFCVATTDPIAKRALSKGADEYTVGWLMMAISVPFLVVYCLFNGGPAPATLPLLATLAAIIPFEIVAMVLYYKALKVADISLSVPFLALTPVFTVATSFMLLGERISLFGLAGVILITLGVYSLNLPEARSGLMNPIKAIFCNRGSRYMVVVAFIYSITSAMCKKAMILSNPQSVPFMYNLAITLGMAPLVVYMSRRSRGRAPVGSVKRGLGLSYLALGLLTALSSIFFFRALTASTVAYVISIKRLSLLISVGYGWLFFKERDIHIRFFSTLCMFLGVALILICR